MSPLTLYNLTVDPKPWSGPPACYAAFHGGILRRED
jgi:hypothetical protein